MVGPNIDGPSDNNSNMNSETSRRTMFLAAAAVATTVPMGSATPAVAAPAPPKSLSEEYRQGTMVLGGSDDDGVVPREAYKKLPSGTIFADTRPGSGEEAVVGKKANLQWVLRKSNGYFVDSSAVSDSVPFIFTIGDTKANAAIAGVDDGIRGMRVGGVRRLLIPPSQAYVTGLDDGKPGPLPVGFGPRQQMRRVQKQSATKDVPGDYIYLEVQLTRLR